MHEVTSEHWHEPSYGLQLSGRFARFRRLAAGCGLQIRG